MPLIAPMLRNWRSRVTDHSAEFRRCMVELDIAAMRRLWRHVSPHLPQPKTDEQTLAALHLARTQARSMPLKLRAYSHRWLIERGMPSQLPDRLRPTAERLYPVVAEAVGISLNARSELIKPIVPLLRGAMENAVLEAYGDGEKDPSIIRGRMNEAKSTAARKLIGINL